MIGFGRAASVTRGVAMNGCTSLAQLAGKAVLPRHFAPRLKHLATHTADLSQIDGDECVVPRIFACRNEVSDGNGQHGAGQQ